MRLRRRRRGQTTTEYLLVISVLVIAFVAAVYDPINQALSDGTVNYDTKMDHAAKHGVFTDDAQEVR